MISIGKEIISLRNIQTSATTFFNGHEEKKWNSLKSHNQRDCEFVKTTNSKLLLHQILNLMRRIDERYHAPR